jgi:hypothetical protein
MVVGHKKRGQEAEGHWGPGGPGAGGSGGAGKGDFGI